jgi:hypothetical protein
MQKLVTAIFILSVSLHSHAIADDIQKFLSECNNSRLASDLSYCIGRIGGVAGFMSYNGYLLTGTDSEALRRTSSCPNTNPAPTYGADVQVFKNWAEKHPEFWSAPDILGIVASIREKWPCQKP